MKNLYWELTAHQTIIHAEDGSLEQEIYDILKTAVLSLSALQKANPEFAVAGKIIFEQRLRK